jgi:hypothetical protein
MTPHPLIGLSSDLESLRSVDSIEQVLDLVIGD